MEASETPYAQLGGDPAVRALADRFYDLMETLPEVEALRRIHPPNLSETREKFFMFLSGWLGGPPRYMEQVGDPMLRRRHLQFPIDSSMRDQWLLCMQRTLDELGIDEGLRTDLNRAFLQVANHMRNTPDQSS
jgi:hemoglobin